MVQKIKFLYCPTCPGYQSIASTLKNGLEKEFSKEIEIELVPKGAKGQFDIGTDQNKTVIYSRIEDENLELPNTKEKMIQVFTNIRNLLSTS